MFPALNSFPREALATALKKLAEENIYIGTSSWKYPGWLGTLYDEQRYIWRGKFAESRFERDCLSEHAEVFHTVCVDAGYYRFPSPAYIDGLMKQTPPGYKFSFKVTDEITARTFPNLPRHGDKAGKRNPHFLDAELFRAAFLSSCAPHRERIASASVCSSSSSAIFIRATSSADATSSKPWITSLASCRKVGNTAWRCAIATFCASPTLLCCASTASPTF